MCTLGMDFAGEVDMLGGGVNTFAIGDRVFGISPDMFGAHAEYLCVPADGAIAHIPRNLPYHEAVVGEGAWYANGTTRILSEGKRCLIYGASGAIGTAAVQLAKVSRSHVTAVVGTRHIDLPGALGADRVVIATGAKWRRDGTGRWLEEPVPGWETPSVITPDDIMEGVTPAGPVVVYDDDHYYMGGVIAEKLRRDGLAVTLVTPANEASTWTTHTEEQHRIQQRILALGIVLETGTTLAGVTGDSVLLECIYTGETREVAAQSTVMVTSRRPQDALFYSLVDRLDIERIGDCLAPGTIATSVYSGHRYAREMDSQLMVPVPFRRE